MLPPIPHRLVPLWGLLAVLAVGPGCDAGVVTAPALGAVGGDGGEPPGPSASDPGLDGRAYFEDSVLPLLESECGSCHGDDERGVGFLAPPDPYAGVLAWPGLVSPGDPTGSELVTKGRHTGPALSGEAQRTAESWILLEGASDDAPPARGDDPPAGGDPAPGGDTRPTAAFAVTTSEADPMSVVFDASASTDPDGDISLYQWDFGDGTTGYGVAATHAYAVPDTYTVQLTVTDRSGASGTATRTVTPGEAAPEPTPDAPRVLRLVLVDADADTAITAHTPLVSGALVDRAALGTGNFSIVAEATEDTDSLRFDVDGVADFQTENAVPYAIAGDSDGDYGAWAPEAGEHTVTATPFAGPDATGTAGAPVTVTFTVL